MRLLEIRNQQISADTRRTGELISKHADLIIRNGIEPPTLLDAQDGIRKQLKWVEDRLRSLRSRATKRDARIGVRVNRHPALKEIRARHGSLLREQVRLLERQRLVLRVAGDAYAWLVLGQNPRILVPLYKDGEHELPAPLSLAGPIMVARKAVKNGKFYIIENDLTRCLGVGDLTITPADRPSRRPLSLEIKTTGKFVEGSTAEIQGIAVETEHPADMILAKAFYEAAGLRDLPEEILARDDPTQTKEMLVRAELLFAATENVEQQVSAVSDKPFQIMRTVLSRALTEGMSWDLSESGIAFFAVKATNGRPDPAAMEDIQDRLHDLGLNAGSAITSEDFLNTPSWSPLARPIPLWPVSAVARSALMNGDLVLGCAVKTGMFARALRDAGLDVIEGNDVWQIRGPFGATTVDQIELAKLALGVAFGGVSPQEIAQRLLQAKPLNQASQGRADNRR